MSQEFILETLEQINQDTGVKIDGDLITFVQRNLFGYHSKTLTDRNSQSSDHHDFMHARFIKHSFYYITAYEKEAKIFQKKYGHLNPNCKILSANQFVEHMKENYNIKFINELKEEQSQNL